MRLIILLFAFLSVGLLQAQHTPHQITESEHSDIQSVLDHQVIQFDNDHLYSASNRNTGTEIQMNLGSHGLVVLNLEEYDLLGENYTIQTKDGILPTRKTVKTLRGYSDDGGAVRLTVAESFTSGYITWKNETYWIEPAWFYMADVEKSNDIVVYRQSDVHADHEMTCGADETAHRTKALRERAAQSRTSSRLGQCYEVELAIASDFSMYTKYNSSITDVENHNVAVINNVSGDYTGAFDDDIEFTIVTQWISDCSTCDPWSSTLDAVMLLENFSDWGLANGFMTNHDLGELWTNRNFNGPTVGIAWVGGLCIPNSKYHCLQDHSVNGAILRVTTSHEIGHNFNGNHAPVNNFILSPVVSTATAWHPNSIASISNYANLAGGPGGCLSACLSGSPPIVDMEPLATQICPETTIKFFDRSTNDPTSWLWTFPGGTPGSSTMQHPSIRYDAPGTFPVILQATNSAGTSTQTFNNLINVGSGGSAFPLYDDFDNGIFDWTVINPDNSVSWDEVTPAAAPGGIDAVYMNNYNYTSVGQRDGLESPIFSLAGFQSAFLHVEYAHAARSSGVRDSLIIYASGDGGQSFQRLEGFTENGSGNFATRLPLNTAFNPTSLQDWCGTTGFGASCLEVDLSNYLGSRDVIVRIENYNNNGNNIFLDRVYVFSDCFDLPPPVAEFTADPQDGCSPLVVQFEDLSQNSPTTWLWTFENGSPATSVEQDPEVLFTTPGQHNVTLFVTNETGTDIETKNFYIDVKDIPIANFSSMANGSTVSFQSLSVDAVDFLWDFGDSNMSADENPTHTYQADGSYQVTLKVFNDCGEDEIAMTVVVGTLPTAGYIGSPLNGCTPLEVQFLSESSPNTTSVFWIFDGGDPSSSTISNPLVTYATPGSFDVTIIATNGTGSDTLVHVDAVQVEEFPVADFSYAVNNLTLSLTNESLFATSYFWTFGDGNTSSDPDPEHTYAGENVYVVTLIASNNCGSDTVSQTVSIGGFPSASFSGDKTSGCAPLSVMFNADNARPGDIVTWTFDGGNPMTSSAVNPTVTYGVPGNYNVRCVVTNALGADTSVVLNYIEVLDQPEADFDMTDDGFLTVILTYTGSEYNTKMWNFGDGTSSTDENPMHLYAEPEGWLVSCIVTNDCGVDSLVKSYTRSQPLLDINLASDVNCVGQMVQFNVEGNNNMPTFDWAFEGGTPSTSMVADPLITYDQSGIYDVTLVATQNGASYTYHWDDTVVIENEPIADFDLELNRLANMSSNANTFAWFVDGSFRSNETDLTIFNEGNYEVQLIATNDCGSDTLTRDIFISATSSLPVLSEGMKVLPNPNRGSFVLAFDKPVGSYNLTVIDSQGREHYRNDFDQQNQSLVLQQLSTGMYLIKAVTEHGIYMDKMIVVE